MPKTRTTRWDAAAHLDSEAAMAAYLAAALEEGDRAVVSAALGDVARAKGMTRVTRKGRPRSPSRTAYPSFLKCDKIPRDG